MMCTNSISNKNAKTIHKNKKPLTELIIKATEQNITEFICSQLFFVFYVKKSLYKKESTSLGVNF